MTRAWKDPGVLSFLLLFSAVFAVSAVRNLILLPIFESKLSGARNKKLRVIRSISVIRDQSF